MASWFLSAECWPSKLAPTPGAIRVVIATVASLCKTLALSLLDYLILLLGHTNLGSLKRVGKNSKFAKGLQRRLHGLVSGRDNRLCELGRCFIKGWVAWLVGPLWAHLLGGRISIGLTGSHGHMQYYDPNYRPSTWLFSFLRWRRRCVFINKWIQIFSQSLRWYLVSGANKKSVFFSKNKNINCVLIDSYKN